MCFFVTHCTCSRSKICHLQNNKQHSEIFFLLSVETLLRASRFPIQWLFQRLLDLFFGFLHISTIGQWVTSSIRLKKSHLTGLGPILYCDFFLNHPKVFPSSPKSYIPYTDSQKHESTRFYHYRTFGCSVFRTNENQKPFPSRLSQRRKVAKRIAVKFQGNVWEVGMSYCHSI